MTNEMIAKYEGMGFKRWTKGDMDRLYINAKELGLECEYYKTGNVSYAEFKGEKISNSRATEMLAAKTYIDIKTGKGFSTNYTLKSALDEIMTANAD